jgi:hypothetical protein
MPDDPSTPAPAPGDDSTPPRNGRNKLIDAYLTDAKKFLKIASEDAEIRPLLETHGYDDAEFVEGTRLLNVAIVANEETVVGRSRQKLTGQALIDALKAARDDYAQFREIARACFPADAARIGLSLKGDVPADNGVFITLATSSYTAAGKDPYKAKLTKRGYPAARLATLLVNLDALTGTDSEQDQAEGESIDDTSDRNDAYKEFKAFMKELRGVARGALRGKHGLLAKLGL